MATTLEKKKALLLKLKKCKEDPIYFFKEYCYISHPQRGRIKFDTYPFQDKVLKALDKYPYSIILKSRQLGISTLAAGRALHLMIFNDNKNVLALATTQATARNLVSKVKFMYDNLPAWLKPDTIEDNKLSLVFKNGSGIKAKSSSPDAARSEAVSLLIIDEAAFIDNVEETWASAQQTLACVDGNSIVHTSNGLVRIEDMYDNPEEGFNDMEIGIIDRNNQSQNTSHFYKSPKSDTLKITFEDGNSIIATKEHPLLTKEEEWVKSEDLVVGQKIKSFYNHNLFGDEEIKYPTYPSLRKDAHKLEISPIDMSYLVGLWVAEGSYRKNGLAICSADQSIIDWLHTLNFKTYNSPIKHQLSNKIAYKHFKEFLKVDKGAHNKKVPKKILSATQSEQAAFLQGLFDGDGCSHPRGIKYTSVSYQLVQDIYIMLLNFGIKSYIREKEWAPTELVKTSCIGYELHINALNSRLFYDKIGFRLKRKQDNLKHIDGIKTHGGYELEGITPKVVKDFIYESGYTSLRKFNNTVINVEGYLWRGYKNLSYDSITRLLEVGNKDSSSYKTLHNSFKQSKTTFYNKIVKIENWENKVTYDVKVPANESFLCNNLVNHNTGGGAIVLSTPNGIGNWFHQMWVKAENSQNEFIPIRLPWSLHPERDKEWRKSQDDLLGVRMAAQECDCDFLSSGTTVFLPEVLEHYEKNTVKDPLEKRGVDGNYWIFEVPDYSRDYVVVADVARGDGADYSACHVIELETNTQVAEYKGQIPTKDFGFLLVEIATSYNKALLVVENASIGWSTLQTIQDIGYQNLYFSPKGDVTTETYYDPWSNQSNLTPGFTMSYKTRPMVISKLGEYIDERAVVIQSKRTLSELRTFIWARGKAEAQKGYNDDLIMCLGIGMYLRDTALRYRKNGIDMTKQALNNIQVNRTAYQGGYSNNSVKNPYEMDLGDNNKENIKWLF